MVTVGVGEALGQLRGVTEEKTRKTEDVNPYLEFINEENISQL